MCRGGGARVSQGEISHAGASLGRVCTEGATDLGSGRVTPLSRSGRSPVLRMATIQGASFSDGSTNKAGHLPSLVRSYQSFPSPQTR